MLLLTCFTGVPGVPSAGRKRDLAISRLEYCNKAVRGTAQHRVQKPALIQNIVLLLLMHATLQNHITYAMYYILHMV